MSKPDWSKAPGNTTHWDPVDRDWVSFDGGQWYFHTDRLWHEFDPDNSEDFIPKPCTEWNGEGLPPVGVECEFDHPNGDWVPCVTIGVFEGEMVCAPNGCRFYSGAAHRFRPTVNEKQREIDGMVNLWLECDGNTRKFCTKLYEKGYRKPPEAIKGVF